MSEVPVGTLVMLAVPPYPGRGLIPLFRPLECLARFALSETRVLRMLSGADPCESDSERLDGGPLIDAPRWCFGKMVCMNGILCTSMCTAEDGPSV